jgi:3-methylcrotonyl-CoA carboxylase beta subunit
LAKAATFFDYRVQEKGAAFDRLRPSGFSVTQITSKIDTSSDTYRAFAEHNKGLAEELRARVAQAALGGNEKSRERHVSRGKLLPRERVERLLDPGSPLLEIGQLAAGDLYDGEVPGAG